MVLRWRRSSKRLQCSIHPSTIRIGNHARVIKETGTTDNKTTQMARPGVPLIGFIQHGRQPEGEFEHRRAKRFYAHTNKNSKFNLWHPDWLVGPACTCPEQDLEGAGAGPATAETGQAEGTVSHLEFIHIHLASLTRSF